MDIPALLLAVIKSNIHCTINFKSHNDSNTGATHNNMNKNKNTSKSNVTATVKEIEVIITVILVAVRKVLVKTKVLHLIL